MHFFSDANLIVVYLLIEMLPVLKFLILEIKSLRNSDIRLSNRDYSEVILYCESAYSQHRVQVAIGESALEVG